MNFGTSQSIVLDIYHNRYVAAEVAQYDINSRELIVTITNKGQFYKIEDGIEVKLKHLKSDGKKGLYDCEILDNGTVKVEITDQMTVVAGRCDAELMLFKNDTGQVLHTMHLVINVIGSVFPNEEIESSDEFIALENALLRVATIEANEEERKANENTRISAEEIRIYNENNRIENENVRVTSEEQRVLNEEARNAAEELRVSNENSRIETEEIRVSNESKRIESEEVRKSNEDTRIDTENVRVSAENIRIDNESARLLEEETRVSNENSRNSAEQVRISNENTRIASEMKRNTDENVRLENELDRISNEEERKNAELVRQENEASRVAVFDDMRDAVENAVENGKSYSDSKEIVSESEPVNQITGDFWLLEY